METEEKELKDENADIRDKIDEHLPVSEEDNKTAWELIDDLVDNEIELEKLCGE